MKRRVAVARLVAVLLAGAVLLALAWPSRALPRLAVWAVLGLAFGVTALESAVRYGLTGQQVDPGVPTRRLLVDWLADNSRIGQDGRLDLFRQVFYDGKDARRRVARFAILMGFASTIATAGIIADSTAVVIGAMLIAPLITPMMGMALGLVMGWQSKLGRASLLVSAGIVIAVGIGWLMPSLLTTAIDPIANDQIVSRTSPTLLDLVVAVAAGAAGAYALARPDVSSSLPGVAIAIALVPPLAVLGILLHLGDWSSAAGAGLLFTTNLVAILVTGGSVFLITGAAPLDRFNEAQRRGRVAIVAIAALGSLVVVVLAANGASITRDSLDTDQARSTTVEWLGASELSVISVRVDTNVVTVVLAGTGDPPSAQALATDLEESLGRNVGVDLQWIPRNQIVIAAD